MDRQDVVKTLTFKIQVLKSLGLSVVYDENKGWYKVSI